MPPNDPDGADAARPQEPGKRPPKSRPPRERPPPRPPNLGPAATRAAALRHLERFSCSAADLTRVLERRILRARDRGATLDAVDEETARRTIATVVGEMGRLGYVDDRRFAETKALSLSRQGKGRRAIADRLRRAGIDGDGIQAALTALAAESEGDPDRRAAIKLARRRRLGPFRATPEDRADRRQRDMAALARAGFDLDLCRTIVEAPTVDALEAPGDADG